MAGADELLTEDELLDDLIQSRAAAALSKELFGHDLAPGQEEMARVIAFPQFPQDRRVAINAMTRYGKTFALADGICLRFLFDPDPLDVKLIAPTTDQAEILRGYIVDNVLQQPALARLLDLDARGIQRLKKEVSRKKFTFSDGKELSVFSAEGKANRLMGHGGDLIVLDEACLVPDPVYDNKVRRMLGDNPDGSQLVLLSNPWHKEGFYYREWQNQSWRRIHVGWQQALAEGRTTQSFIDGERIAVPPTTFQVLYESQFPDQAEDQLIPWTWIQRAIRKTPNGIPIPLRPEAKVNWGADVAEGGGDATVLTKVARTRQTLSKLDPVLVIKQEGWHYADTMATADLILAKVGPGAHVGVDETGVGKGVCDRLAQLGVVARGIKTGRAAAHPERFLNLGSEILWTLRTLFEAEAIILVNPAAQLLTDLTKWRYTTSSGKVKVEVAGGKKSGGSPDYGDSLAYAVWAQPQATVPRKVARPGLLV